MGTIGAGCGGVGIGGGGFLGGSSGIAFLLFLILILLVGGFN